VILFVGIQSEPPLAMAIAEAARAGIPHLVLHQRHAADCELTWHFGAASSGTLRLREHGESVPLERFTGVYLRPVDWRTLPEFTPGPLRRVEPETLERVAALHDALFAWAEIAGCRVMNRLSAMASNSSKPYQSQILRECRVRIPETLVTNDPGAARAFIAAHGRVVYKSISGVRSIVQAVEPPAESRLDRVQSLPTQFQGWVPGTNVRVHVVGDAVFATRVEGDAVDYRYAEREGVEVTMSATELPDEQRKACLELARCLDLPLCGIDLKLTPAGEWYCFEANPSPAYSCFEEQTGQPIARAIAEYLGQVEHAGADSGKLGRYTGGGL
jgi:glutathione synthase/RimK-type ligase-like ATP-grasp enzyme